MCAEVPNMTRQHEDLSSSDSSSGVAYTNHLPYITLCSLSPGCCNSVAIAGASDVQFTRMGQFTKIPGVTKNYRPVYINSHKQYLYYWMTTHYQAWHIGSDYNSVMAGVRSKPNERTACPVDATPPWLEWHSSQWHDRSSITADCGMFMPEVPEGSRVTSS